MLAAVVGNGRDHVDRLAAVGHRAAVALGHVHDNFCHVVKTLRVTPAMQLGIADSVWSLAELDAALMTSGPCEAPARQPLAPRVPETTHRELPGGRGFLRVVYGGKASQSASTPPAAPVLSARVEASAAGAAPREAWEQLDLLAWRPTPPPKGQLSLFPDDPRP